MGFRFTGFKMDFEPTLQRVSLTLNSTVNLNDPRTRCPSASFFSPEVSLTLRPCSSNKNCSRASSALGKRSLAGLGTVR
jgi:hypothetical protein